MVPETDISLSYTSPSGKNVPIMKPLFTSTILFISIIGFFNLVNLDTEVILSSVLQIPLKLKGS